MKPDISEKEKKVYVTLYKKDAPSYAMILLATLLEFVYVVSILDAGFLYDGRCGDREHFPFVLAVYLCGEGECVRNTLGSS